MRKIALLVLIVALSATTNFAQDSPSSTSPVDRNVALNRLLKEAEDQRALIEAYKKQEAALRKQIAEMEVTDQKLTESYRQALIEIGELRAKITFTERALVDKNEEIRVLREALAKKDGEIKSLRKQLLVERLINGGILLLKILK